MHDYNGHHNHLSHHHGHHNQIINGMEEGIEEIVGGDHGGDGDDDDNQMGNAIALEQQQQMQIYIDPKSKQHYAAKETPNGMELYPLIIQNTPLHLENVTGASQYVLNLEDGSTGHVMIPDDSMPSTSSAYYHQNSPSTSSSSTSHHQNPTGRHLENQKAPKRRKPNYMSQEDSMGFRRPDDVNSVRQHLTGMGGATAPTRGNKKTPAKRRRS
ncbi:CRE-NFYB-1 protein [Caenorhabditis remanei]|uniref:CRE-NFYB-1 protein n=1 Tax=Caenorhabditis remanei TaxID=31234 RepID=E3NLL6_CAERE|nr:CRE-NFYB-1 protein [Caenorhabditis remanei]